MSIRYIILTSIPAMGLLATSCQQGDPIAEGTSPEPRPESVVIQTKFVEVTSGTTEELGFDWVVGPFDSSEGK